MPCLSAPSRRRRWVERFASSWIGRSPPRVKLSTDIDGRRDAHLCHLEPPGSLGGFRFADSIMSKMLICVAFLYPRSTLVPGQDVR